MGANPLAVQFWLWGQDALAGLLQAQGFCKAPNPIRRGSSLYLRDGVGLHSSAAWLEWSGGVLVYSRPSEAFFYQDSAQGLPELNPARQPVPWAEGLAQFQPLVQAYEEGLWARLGLGYRTAQLGYLPSLARRALPAWWAWIGRRPPSAGPGHCSERPQCPQPGPGLAGPGRPRWLACAPPRDG